MKNKLAIKIIVYLLVIIALIFAYAYGFKFLKNKNQSIADKQAMIDNQISKMEQTFDTKKQSDTVLKIGDDVNQRFLTSSEIPAFLAGLELISSRTGAILRISSVDEIINAEGTALGLNISASGDYKAVYKTLVELENLPYFSSINNLALSVNQDQNYQTDFGKKAVPTKSTWSLSANLVIKSYTK